jgi:GH25 family lysozyme M1 (1,4-beta-N-acetylmuramidase)
VTTFYTDISHHDWNRAKGELDFRQIFKATSPAICIRATYGDPKGTHYPTYHFQDMAKQARSAGFTLLGAYHNLVRGDSASIKRQVDWLRSEMDKAGANWAMLDVERYKELMDNGQWPRWDDVSEFATRWADVDKRVLAFYIPDWIWDASLAKHSLTGLRGPLVASEYGSNPAGLGPQGLYARQGGDTSDKWHAYGGRTPELLQFGSRCVVPGLGNTADINAFRGTFNELTRLLINKEAIDVAKLDAEDYAAIAAAVEKKIFSHIVPKTATGDRPDRSFDVVLSDVYLRVLGILAALTDADDVDETAVAEAVIKGLGLTPASIAAAIPETFAADLLAELAKLLNARVTPQPAPTE